MLINHLYHTWFDKIKQLRPNEHAGQSHEDDPWLLATTCLHHKRRCGLILAECGLKRCSASMKGNGFDLESTHLHNFLRLSRLTLAVAFLYVWLISIGAR